MLWLNLEEFNKNYNLIKGSYLKYNKFVPINEINCEDDGKYKGKIYYAKLPNGYIIFTCKCFNNKDNFNCENLDMYIKKINKDNSGGQIIQFSENFFINKNKW